jgi:hypothetical protein
VYNVHEHLSTSRFDWTFSAKNLSCDTIIIDCIKVDKMKTDEKFWTPATIVHYVSVFALGLTTIISCLAISRLGVNNASKYKITTPNNDDQLLRCVSSPTLIYTGSFSASEMDCYSIVSGGNNDPSLGIAIRSVRTVEVVKATRLIENRGAQPKLIFGNQKLKFQ